MKKDQSMKEIEELLKMAPTYEDTRTKEEVFARLKKEGLFDEERQQENEAILDKQLHKPNIIKKNYQTFKIWTMAAVAFISFGAVAGYLMSQNSSNDSSSSAMDESAESTMMQDRAAQPFSIEMNTEESSNAPLNESRLVWPSAQQTTFTIGLVTEQLDVVPVTILIDDNQIKEQFGEIAPSYTELYQYITAHLDEESYGFINYHPLEGQVAEMDGKLTFYLHENHQIDAGSASEMLYFQVMNMTFGNAYDQLEILTADGGVPEFAHTGTIDNPVALEGTAKSLYYVTQTLGTNYITPFAHEDGNIEQALQQLKQSPEPTILKSPIMEGVQYTVSNNGDFMTIAFTSPVTISEQTAEDVYLMLDALTMTAASYGGRVQFENVIDVAGNQVNYPNGTELPLGANKVILNLK